MANGADSLTRIYGQGMLKVIRLGLCRATCCTTSQQAEIISVLTHLPGPGAQPGHGQEAGQVCSAQRALAACCLPEVVHSQKAGAQLRFCGRLLELPPGEEICQWRLQKIRRC